MPTSCSAYNCTNRSNKTTGISYFSFPLSNEELTKRWVISIRRENWWPTKASRICSDHFEENFMYFVNDCRRLLSNAVPTVFNFPKHLQRNVKERHQPKKRENTCVLSDENLDVQECKTDVANGLHNYVLPSPSKLHKKYLEVVNNNHICKQKLKNSKQQERRKLEQLVTKEKLIEGLNKRLCESASSVVYNCFSDVIEEIVKFPKGEVKQYSDKIRQFALTLHFYSARAYTFLRKHVKLPHPRTLRQWASFIDGRPGFTEESFKKIAEEMKNSSGPIYCALMFDEIAIKKELVWDGKEVCGYVDLGHGYVDSIDRPVANEALVFMVTALNRTWKIPVGYCLVSGISAAIKMNLIEQYLEKLHDTGVSVVVVVCDGLATNRTVMEKLGVVFHNNVEKCWFPHTSFPERKVFCILDAAHVLKLVRNLLAEKETLFDGDNNAIKWQYFKNLVHLQENEGLHAANKLRRQHVQFQAQKMKVSLAAQTLSRSVACSLSFCKELSLEEFEDCGATIKFVENVNLAFDILNSCHPMGKGTKSPITRRNREVMVKNIDQCISYFQNLKLGDGTFVMESNRKTAILGFILDLKSVKMIAETYVWCDDPELPFLLTRRLSQDHLELFFSSVRNRGGHNNNPNARQFKGAYRKCLVARIDPSKKANCAVEDSPVLLPTVSVATCLKESNDIVLNSSENTNVFTYNDLSLYVENVVEYIAGCVVRQAAKRIKCDECFQILFASDESFKRGLTAIRDINDCLLSASPDVVKLCKIAEKVYRGKKYLTQQKNIIPSLEMEVFQMMTGRLFIGNDHLFNSVDVDEEPHYYHLTKLILHQYFTIRLHHSCRNITENQRGKPIRQVFTKLIHFKGQ